MKSFLQSLNSRRQAGLYRQRRVSESAQGPRQHVEGREVLSFCSNDYLGLATHPLVVKSFQQAANDYGVGSGAAHLINGHSLVHHKLEQQLAQITGYERALIFSTGFMANQAVLTALCEKSDRILLDKLDHASLIDGALASAAAYKRYPHADMDAVEKLLQQAGPGDDFVVTDGVFSMDGDLAPLDHLSQLCSEYAAHLVVDDAHGFGVLGANGLGTREVFNLSVQQVPVSIITFGKALGSFGAAVLADAQSIEMLIQSARSYIYTTALPPAVAAATQTSLQLMQVENWRRDKLQQLINHFRQGAVAIGLPLMDSDTAIQPLLIGDSEKASALAQALLQKNIWVSAIRPPTVPAGSARLRISLNSLHENSDIDYLLEALQQCLN